MTGITLGLLMEKDCVGLHIICAQAVWKLGAVCCQELIKVKLMTRKKMSSLSQTNVVLLIEYDVVDIAFRY